MDRQVHGQVKAGADGSFSLRTPPFVKTPVLMYAILLFCFGITAYLFGVALVVPRYLLGLNAQLVVENVLR